MDAITSLELYLREDAVVETGSLEDVAAGIYPVYYRRSGDRLKVSTSVVSLLADAGTFTPDPSFTPPDYLRGHFTETDVMFRVKRRLNRHFNWPTLERFDSSWYPVWNTIDNTVKKLRAFETVTPDGAQTSFSPDYTIHDQASVIEYSARYITQFIHDIERAFPAYNHVVLTGGKDSQLIWLAPKLASQNWHMFSADPNYPLVMEWLERNAIPVNRTFRHDNRNDESAEDLKTKIVCGDLYADPSHIRWMPSLVNIAASFPGGCIFWGGTMSNPAHFYAGHHRKDYSQDKMAFFRAHFERTACWQGNYHQVFKNFSGRPHLSPYHSREIWSELYRHIDPTSLPRDQDLRTDVGECLYGKPVWWATENPGPSVYQYGSYVNARKIYLRHIQRVIAARPS